MKEISLTIFNLLSILSLFGAALFAFQLYFLKERNTSTKYFSFYLLSISVIVAFFLIVELEFQKIAVGAIPIFMFALLSLGPILWLTVNSTVGGKKNKIIKHLFIPIVSSIVFVLLLGVALLLKDVPSGEFVQDVLTYVTIITLTLVFVLQSGYYIYQSLKLYKKHLIRVEEVFSYTERVNLHWLKLFVYGYIVFILGLVVSNLLDDVWSDIFFYTVLFGYIIFSGYNALRYEPVFKADDEITEKETKVEVDVKNEFFTKLKSELIAAMETQKLYLDEALTIHSLATKLDTNSKYLSQLINTEFKKSFVVFVNEYRVNEAKLLLKDEKNKNLTIEGIGYEAGFKSKSAFNSAFKKFTGDTPSSFLKKEI
ncbi:MAG: helix-turn-helix domain-containing protein [Vicingaceae bacterium]